MNNVPLAIAKCVLAVDESLGGAAVEALTDIQRDWHHMIAAAQRIVDQLELAEE